MKWHARAKGTMSGGMRVKSAKAMKVIGPATEVVLGLYFGLYGLIFGHLMVDWWLKNVTNKAQSHDIKIEHPRAESWGWNILGDYVLNPITNLWKKDFHLLQ